MMFTRNSATAVNLLSLQKRTFTRAVKKIILTKDWPGLGYKGEICFVKPGYALNLLVPKQIALFYTDPAAQAFKTDEAELKKK